MDGETTMQAAGVLSPASSSLAVMVFAATLLVTFALAALGRRHSPSGDQGALSEQRLNRWLIGLSAGAAANSGFIVTGAVALGYQFGLQWLLLPFGWLIGDIVFWSIFPGRLNGFGRRSQATTLSELLTHGLQGRIARVLGILCAAVVLICLSGYVSAQWLAGQRFVEGAFPISDVAALGLFAAVIIAYTAIGGFRGSVYVDSLQAVIRLIGSALALAAVAYFAMRVPDEFSAHIADAGASFLSLSPAGGAMATVGLLIGFAAAALGFGLGQPHLVSRYLAGATAHETKAAWWIYIGFVQFTWVTMTLFGVVLRGVMPDLAEPEAGLSLFFNAKMGAIATGLIVADVFATIAATSNSLLVAMAQVLVHDLAPAARQRSAVAIPAGCIALGIVTMALSLVIEGSVVGLALSSVSMMAAAIAPAVMIRVLGWRHDAASLLAAVVTGMLAALAWKLLAFDALVNEAAIGIASGLVANALLCRKTNVVNINRENQ